MKKCSKCNIEKELDQYYKKKRNGYEGLYSNCKTCFIETTKAWAKKNPDKVKKYNKDKEAKRYQSRRDCPKRKVRQLLANSIRNRGYSKTSKTFEILGCDYDTFVKHIERQFKGGMNWSNYGLRGWHYDHLMPISSAASNEDIIRLNHYTNIRPLWATENLIKSDKIIEHQTILPI